MSDAARVSGGTVALAPPCPCEGNLDLSKYADWAERLERRRVFERRAAGCPEHGVPGGGFRWRPAAWESVARWPFRWPWSTR